MRFLVALLLSIFPSFGAYGMTDGHSTFLVFDDYDAAICINHALARKSFVEIVTSADSKNWNFENSFEMEKATVAKDFLDTEKKLQEENEDKGDLLRGRWLISFFDAAEKYFREDEQRFAGWREAAYEEMIRWDNLATAHASDPTREYINMVVNACIDAYEMGQLQPFDVIDPYESPELETDQFLDSLANSALNYDPSNFVELFGFYIFDKAPVNCMAKTVNAQCFLTIVSDSTVHKTIEHELILDTWNGKIHWIRYIKRLDSNERAKFFEILVSRAISLYGNYEQNNASKNARYWNLPNRLGFLMIENKEKHGYIHITLKFADDDPANTKLYKSIWRSGQTFSQVDGGVLRAN